MFLDHALAVTEVYIQLVLAERDHQLGVRRFVAEPGAWRTFLGRGGARVTLKPDAYAVVLVDGYEDHWFLEVDRGTESAAALARKFEVYRSYWQSGTEQARHEDLFPRVLWLVPDTARAEVIRQVIRRVPENARGLFEVALLANAVARLKTGAA
jgi:hypothetical protein